MPVIGGVRLDGGLKQRGMLGGSRLRLFFSKSCKYHLFAQVNEILSEGERGSGLEKTVAASNKKEET